MGILNIVFGSIFLLCFLCDGGQFTINAAGARRPRAVFRDPAAEVLLALQAEVPGYTAYQVSRILLNLGLAILLLTAGIGLLNMQRWARVGSIVYAITTILLEVFTLIFHFVYVYPVASRVLQQAFGPFVGDPGFFVELINFGTVASAFILTAYAVVLLIMMLLPGTGAALAAGLSAVGYGRDRYDEGGYDYDDGGYRYDPRRRRRDDWD
jgi:hypothetical protein